MSLTDLKPRFAVVAAAVRSYAAKPLDNGKAGQIASDLAGVLDATADLADEAQGVFSGGSSDLVGGVLAADGFTPLAANASPLAGRVDMLRTQASSLRSYASVAYAGAGQTAGDALVFALSPALSMEETTLELLATAAGNAAYSTLASIEGAVSNVVEAIAKLAQGIGATVGMLADLAGFLGGNLPLVLLGAVVLYFVTRKRT